MAAGWVKVDRAKADADIKRVDAKLSNEKFVANAPEEIIEGEKEKREEAQKARAENQAARQKAEGARQQARGP